MANFNLDTTYKLACEKLSQKAPQEVAINSGSHYDERSKVFHVKYLNSIYEVTFPQGEVKLKDSDEEVNLSVQILILHYLINANGAPLQDKLISFKELPDGAIYIEPFTRRAINPMLKVFQNNFEDFVRLAEELGGSKSHLGDVSVTVYVFPNVPITYVMWAADDEFAASGNILFDASASNYLPTEDYALVSSLVIYKMCDMLKK